MKELHNHIFSNTTCISKETMLKHINHQLSTKELHEVEKHLLDCEFCSEAIEGLKYAEDSSVLFAIDNRIDQRVRLGGTKKPVMRNLMVAASILVIAFGAYFTFDYFNNTVNNQIGLALKEEKEEDVDIKTESNEKEIAIDNQPKEADLNDGITSSSTKNNSDLPIGYFSATNEQAPSAPMIEEVLEDEEETEIMMDATIERSGNSELKKESLVSGKNKEEEKLADRRNSDKLAENGNISVTGAYKQQTTPETSFGFAAESDDTKDTDLMKDEVQKLDKKRSESTSKGNKQRFKAKSSVPSSTQQDNFADALEEKTSVSNNRNQEGTVTLSNHKVVDYLDEYQKEYDLKQVVETKSVSADFETQAEAEAAEREIDETTVEVTYRATLEKAMGYYNAKKYSLALEQFNIILKEHPEEVNGLFYGGLSNYHLQRYDLAKGELDKVLENPKTSFNEEAEWYKALTLIQLNNISEAKQLLQKIVDGNGFYKIKAQEKLKNL